MNISLNTKFNIGDAVYFAETYEDYWANKEPYIVTDIMVKVNKYGQSIVYRISQNCFTDTVSEHMLFQKYEDCAKWCKEHS